MASWICKPAFWPSTGATCCPAPLGPIWCWGGSIPEPSPFNGQSFAIVTYGSESGQFASQQLPALASDWAWQITYGATAVTLNVVHATIITDATRLANGHFQFSLSGPSATSALIQASTNLVDWTSLQTNVPFTGLLLFDDAQALGYPVRFYRVVMQP